jgi:hypothetical protein
MNTCDKFKENVLLLAHNFKAMNLTAIDMGYDFVDNGIMTFIEIYLSRLNSRDMVVSFVKFSHMYWNEIASRDKNFFYEHAERVFDFSGKDVDSEIGTVAGQKNVFLFKQLLTTPGAVREDDIYLIWNFFEVLVKISFKASKEDWFPRDVRETLLDYPDIENIVARMRRKNNN